MDTQFAKFLQIGIIVEDVEEAIRHYEEYGIGPWTRFHLDSDKLPGTFTMDGKEERLEVSIGFCHIWGFEIELIQPVSESAYLKWLREHGPGMQHIALITRDSFPNVLEENKRLTGREPWIYCKNQDIGLEYAYLDLDRELGLVLEVYNEEKQGGLPMDFQVPEGECEGAIDTQFAKFRKLGLVVENVEESIRHFEEYGVGPWKQFRLDTDNFPGTFTMNGKEERLDLILGSCQCWGFELELIQPVSESPYKDWLREHGPGMHHIAVATRDSFADAMAEYKERTGRESWLWCKDQEIGLEFAFMDLRRELGFLIEIYNEDKNDGLDANLQAPAE